MTFEEDFRQAIAYALRNLEASKAAQATAGPAGPDSGPRNAALLEFTLQLVTRIAIARGTLTQGDSLADNRLCAALVPLEELLRLAQARNGIEIGQFAVIEYGEDPVTRRVIAQAEVGQVNGCQCDIIGEYLTLEAATDLSKRRFTRF
jgi:hypothetical protein